MNHQNKLKSLSLGVTFFLMALHVSATHNRGAHIAYKRVSPFTQVVGSQTVQVYNYHITVFRYHNQGVNVAERCADTVYFGDGGSGVAMRVNGSACTTCGSTITCGVPLPQPLGGKVSTYTIQHTYPGPGTYTIRSFDPNRSPDIENITNSINHPSYVESVLIISSTGANHNSVDFQDPDVAIAHPNQCWHHTPVTLEADGDSLSFEITTSRGQGGLTIPGYSHPAGTYGFNGGWLQWCNPQQLGIYSISYIVKEWRKNSSGTYELAGYVLRDIEVTVLPTTAIGELSHLISISPNPSRDMIRVTNAQGGEISIALLSLTGQVLYSAKEESDHAVHLGHLPPGIYFLKIEKGGQQLMRKIVRE